jgi:hypothetical protein
MIERSVLLGLKPMLLLAHGVTVTISKPDEVPSDESAYFTNPDPVAMRLVVPVDAIASVPEIKNATVESKFLERDLNRDRATNRNRARRLQWAGLVI